MFCKKINRNIVKALSALLLVGAQVLASYAQSEFTPSDIDPRLIEIVEEVKKRGIDSQSPELRGSPVQTPEDVYAERRIEALRLVREAEYSKDPEKIRIAIQDFKKIDKADATPSLDQVVTLYGRHAGLLEAGSSLADHQNEMEVFETSGSWLERYFATQLSMQFKMADNERQAALQKAQLGFQLIPDQVVEGPYIKFAKSDTASVLAQLHNLQGNVDFAIVKSLEFLDLTEGETDAKAAIDLINNLIFSHSVARDHPSLLYLGEQLIEIETTSTSTVPGLSEFRVAQGANMAGNYEKGLRYARLAAGKSQHPQVSRQAIVNEAVALAGLGRKAEARRVMTGTNVRLDSDTLLNSETRQDTLYLGFLLAQGSDEVLARQLYSRQIDVTSQKFLANSSRDTTAMLAELENSRERQLEREAASAREAQLQALTIDRQRKLNRALMGLVLLLSGAALASFLIMRAREKLLRKLEIKTIEAASAEKLKTEFLGMISHELRTPLNGIIGISDFLTNYHEDADIREKTNIILRSGNELLGVVESLTDMARLDAGQLNLAPHDADLAVSLNAVPALWAEKASAKDLAFTHFIDAGLSTHFVDEDRLVQCLNILLENAVRFTDSGRVHLHITANSEGQSDVTNFTAIIADTGQGMSELVQSRLFTPFMQADTSRKRAHMGTGLSLAIAYALANMMGGSLSVVSREGRGSEFKLTIPLQPATGKVGGYKIRASEGLPHEQADEPAATENTLEANNIEEIDSGSVLTRPVLDGPNAPQREFVDLMQPNAGFPSLHEVQELVLPMPKQGRQRILVVDDVDSNRDILRLILESQGHTCSEAADGFAALAALERQTFDLIVLDIHMAPLDGVETLRRLRVSGKPYAEIPVVALTADNAASTNAACMEAGADLFLAKPVRQEELLRAIDYLHQSDGARILSQ